jgi:hypothetical protein
MADFCKQCSIDTFGKDFEELALPKDDVRRGTLKPGYGWLNICESCGPILTDDDGVCTDPRCPIHGEKPTLGPCGAPL